MIVGKKSIQYTNLIFHKGGSEVEIELMLEGVFCSVNLVRNSNVRKRIINIMSDQHLQLDFSQEPGVIKKESLSITGDEKWDLDIKPVAQMLSAFLVQSIHTFCHNARKPLQLSIPYNSPKIRSKIKIELLQTDLSNQI